MLTKVNKAKEVYTFNPCQADKMAMPGKEWTTDSGYRRWVFTLNNYTPQDIINIFDGGIIHDWHTSKGSVDSGIEYLVTGKEVGESNPHLQGYIVFKNPKKLGLAKGGVRSISQKAHWEPSWGSPTDASNYCKKGEQSHEEWKLFKSTGHNWGLNADFKEFGTLPTLRQGKRNDLIELGNQLLEGTVNCRDLRVNPDTRFAAYQYGRLFEKLFNDRYSNIERTFQTFGIHLVGGTGAGKSFAIMQIPKHLRYTCPMDNSGWCDFYQQEQFFVFNEFRGQWQYSKLLEMVDRWSYDLPRRNVGPIPFMSRFVVVTSTQNFEQLYHNITSFDDINQIKRRFITINMTKGTICNLTNLLEIDLVKLEALAQIRDDNLNQAKTYILETISKPENIINISLTPLNPPYIEVGKTSATIIDVDRSSERVILDQQVDQALSHDSSLIAIESKISENEKDILTTDVCSTIKSVVPNYAKLIDQGIRLCRWSYKDRCEYLKDLADNNVWGNRLANRDVINRLPLYGS